MLETGTTRVSLEENRTLELIVILGTGDITDYCFYIS